MKAEHIIEQLEKKFPLCFAAQWDNVGLLAGRRVKEVSSVYVALDATDEIIDDALEKQADMIITHHPLIFSAIKKINTDDFIGNRLIKIIQNDITYYAMHTNYDVSRMAALSAEIVGLKECQVLEPTTTEEPLEGYGRVGSLPAEMTLQQCSELVKERFHLENVKVFGDLNDKIRRTAISPGSGKSMIDTALSAGAQVLITGDIDHHEGIDAVARGIAIIDAGHYGLEHIFIRDMQAYLQENWGELQVYAESIHNPFQIV